MGTKFARGHLVVVDVLGDLCEIAQIKSSAADTEAGSADPHGVPKVEE
jgi:hypothetical protein